MTINDIRAMQRLWLPISTITGCPEYFTPIGAPHGDKKAISILLAVPGAETAEEGFYYHAVEQFRLRRNDALVFPTHWLPIPKTPAPQGCGFFAPPVPRKPSQPVRRVSIVLEYKKLMGKTGNVSAHYNLVRISNALGIECGGRNLRVGDSFDEDVAQSLVDQYPVIVVQYQ